MYIFVGAIIGEETGQNKGSKAVRTPDKLRWPKTSAFHPSGSQLIWINIHPSCEWFAQPMRGLPMHRTFNANVYGSRCA